jgi:hypothetical protein
MKQKIIQYIKDNPAIKVTYIAKACGITSSALSKAINYHPDLLPNKYVEPIMQFLKKYGFKE